MRAKVAKRLRREARRLTVGKPGVAYYHPPGQPRRLTWTCTRNHYKRLKRELRV